MHQSTTTSALAVLIMMFAWNSALGQFQTERQALLEVYQATGGENWISDDGWLEADDHCNWEGVRCNTFNEARYVASLNLSNNGLSGQLPHTLAGLAQLTALRLSGNSLSGQLPDNRWNLESLSTLDIADNAFSGPIPDWILGLGNATLSDNRFSGYRVSGQLDLSSVDLGELQLSGNLLEQLPPAPWLQGASLRELDLSDNRLTGTVDLDQLPIELRRLDLSGNQLTMVTGLQESALPELRLLGLAGNRLTTWPDGLAASALDALDLADNQLSGPLPEFVGDLELVAIDISNNSLSGSVMPLFEALKVPDDSGNWLLIADNEFDGAVPEDVDYSRFNSVDSPNRYSRLLDQFGVLGLDLCWNDLEASPGTIDAINDSRVHRGRTPESCMHRTRRPISPTISGSWYAPGRSGEGISQMLLDTGQIMVYWFTYTDLGSGPDEQMWLVDVVQPNAYAIESGPLSVPLGGRFSLGFSQSSERDQYADFRLRQDRLDESSAMFFYEHNGGRLCNLTCYVDLDTERFEQVRLTRLAGTSCDTQSEFQQYSGAWYSPERSGEGFVIEVLPDDRIVAYWFTFQPDDSGYQAWMTGDGQFDDPDLAIDPPPGWAHRAQLSMYRPVGTDFGEDFDSNDVEAHPWGEVEFRFDDEDTGSVVWNSTIEGYGSGEYPIQRLAEPRLADCD